MSLSETRTLSSAVTVWIATVDFFRRSVFGRSVLGRSAFGRAVAIDLLWWFSGIANCECTRPTQSADHRAGAAVTDVSRAPATKLLAPSPPVTFV
jgi:hypothetical protein